MTSSGARVSSPRRITEPLPNCFSICASATSSAFSRSPPAMSVHPLPGPVVPPRRVRSVDVASSGQTLDRATDSPRDARCGLWRTTGRGRLLSPSNPNTCSTSLSTRRQSVCTRGPRRATVTGVSELVIRPVDPRSDADMDAFQGVYAAAERAEDAEAALYSREDAVAMLLSSGTRGELCEGYGVFAD